MRTADQRGARRLVPLVLLPLLMLGALSGSVGGTDGPVAAGDGGVRDVRHVEDVGRDG